eukprot:TRINITY_DN47682_c0_g1_i1.p1 TRINITY_DN47682_c0_g1~~TRINITY_DN47682_c0_g1_i1.p1  ORF type:complete len:102 (+),score=3.28 TRINITY_DN47682_c0_g1_i1:123-428(+)
MLRSLVGSEMCIRDSINAEYGGGCSGAEGTLRATRPFPAGYQLLANAPYCGRWPLWIHRCLVVKKRETTGERQIYTFSNNQPMTHTSVSYTHLTLPTKRIV